MTEFTSGLDGRPSPRRRRGWVIALGLVGIILIGNAVVFYFYKQMKEAPRMAEMATAEGGGSPALPPGAEQEICSKCGKPVTAGHRESHSRAEELRAEGIELLRGSEYGRALAAFKEAQGLYQDLENIDDLIEVSQKLERDRRRAAPRPSSQPAPDVIPNRGASSSGRNARRTERKRTAPPPAPPVAPKSAVILVTTRPERLVVHIDGEVRDLSPARIEVNPGRHRVEIFDGEKSLVSETVTVGAGDVELINRAFDLESSSAGATPAQNAVAARPEGIQRDRDLNLVELLDRGDVASPPPSIRPSAKTAASSSPPAEQAAPSPQPKSPRVLLYYPGRNADRVHSGLAQGLSGIEVQLVGTESRLRRELASGADAVVASSFVLRGMGLAPSLVAEGGGDYALASFKAGITPSQAASGTVAVLDELGRKGTPPYLARILGVSTPPSLRRVTKVEDLLTLLQLGQADAIVVRPQHLKTLRGRTQRTLHSIRLRAPSVALAVAFVDGGRRTTIEPRIKNLPGEARAELGITRWATR